MRKLPLTALVVVLFGAPSHADAPAPAMFPFVIPWEDASKGVANDVSFLNSIPAGKNGFIIVKNGHFAESRTGQRIRFLGTNFTFQSDYPSHEDAEKIAAHLAKLGINIVRIHHEDFNRCPIWNQAAIGHTKIDPAGMDKLDYLIAELKKNGIYLDLNLHVSRSFVPEDGFPASVKDIPDSFDKRIDNIDRHMIELQKKFAGDYLGHVNQYTGLTYASDPAIAIVEINNENSLFGGGNDAADFVNSLPEPFRSEIQGAWNDWLTRKYQHSAALTAAWRPHAVQTSTDMFSASSRWSLEDRTQVAKLTTAGGGSATCAPDVHFDVPVASPLYQEWHTQAHIWGLDLANGGAYTLSFRAKADTVRKITVYAGMDEEDWHNVGLNVTPTIGTDWKPYRYTFQSTHTVPNHSRISFVLGGATGGLSFADVKLTAGVPQDILMPGETLESRNVEVPSSGSIAQLSDWRHYLADSETAYATEMRAYLRDDLKVHANIVDTQLYWANQGMSGFAREAGSDFADAHNYWQHPYWPVKAWTGDWIIGNTPMTDSLAHGEGGTFAPLAAYRIAGKPFTVSEYDHPSPSDFRAEMYPEIATFAAIQDWDAIFHFEFGPYGDTNKFVNAPPSNDVINGFFSDNSDPVREGFIPEAALIFRSGAIAPASTVATLHLSPAMSFAAERASSVWQDCIKDFASNLLSQRFETTLDPAVSASRVTVAGVGRNSQSAARVVSTPAGTQYLASSDRVVAAAGYVGGQTLKLGNVALAFPQFGNNFASLAITPLDGVSIGRSKRLLLTIGGKAENTGVVWNSARNHPTEWGHAPVLAEGIPACVMIGNAFITHVWALDTTGARSKELPVSIEGGKVTFNIGPEYQTIWYELAK